MSAILHSTEGLKQRIAELAVQHGSLRAAARVLKVSPAYLSRLASGEKTAPGDALLRRMGLLVTTTYTRATCPATSEPRGCWSVRCQLGNDCANPGRNPPAPNQGEAS